MVEWSDELINRDDLLDSFNLHANPFSIIASCLSPDISARGIDTPERC